MTTLFLGLPVLTLILGWWRPNPVWLYPTNMGVLVVAAAINLWEVALGETVKKVTLVTNFLPYPTLLQPEPVALGVYVDFYTANMLWIVFVISFLVHLYSTAYLGGDPRLPLFLSYLTLFTFFMVVLLVAPNFVQLFLGWEGVGLTSYLLVNFWHTRAAANKAALKALIVNRVGDFFFLYGLFLLILGTQTIEFAAPHLEGRHPLVGIFLVAAAAAKSAQLGLHTWLPDAMEGPTPVSALIHAATMVTAGVFLLLRAPHLVQDVRPFLLWLGAATTLFAGSVALFQYDLKRVIAYSTCSQLGYMVVAAALDAGDLSLYHLINHAYFKALLFLLAGLVIHAVADEQDTRRMGGLARVMPVTYSLFLVGSLALVGFPFLSGYYSKDVILEVLYAQGHHFSYAATMVAAYFTAFYSFRTIVLVFLGHPRGSRTVYLAAHEGDTKSLGVVTLLGVAALFHGYLTRDFFIGLGNTSGWTTPYLEAEFALPTPVKWLPLVLSATAVAVHQLTRVNWPVSVVWFFSKRWWWDFLDSTVSTRLIKKGYFLYVDLERGLLEAVGPQGVRLVLGRLYELVRHRGWFPTFFTSLGLGFAFLSLVYLGG